MLLKQASVLIIDDDVDVLTAVRLLLKHEVKEIVIEKNPENIRSHLSKNHFDIVLLDMNFNSSINTGNEGLFWLKKIKDLKTDSCVIMITAYADINLAINSLKEGAFDFIVKPWQNEKLLETIKEALKKKDPAGRQSSKPISIEMVGASEAIKSVLYKVEKIAPTDANVLILGENGTGKDLIAKAIHDHSLRANKPFVKVDVGALTESLFESELFGHKKGAFTDAREDRIGRFESANGGTLFLDEIGNITLQQQAKLLSVLQNRQVMRLGSNAPIPIDIRLICATNIPMQELANEQRFRKDLIYRINTVDITMPPLRKRDDDTKLLAEHFCKQYGTRYLKPSIQLDNSALKKLQHYSFPGNVRELQHVIERAVIMAENDKISADDLSFSSLETLAPVSSAEDNMHLSTLERNAILKVIDKHNGNITRAAKELGLTRTALYRRLNKHDI
ncbi:MAG TPA: sigma-54 dependent transcriptional regulator [Chitinophagaceae bacterium]|jgi:DNA-binding NtrC family response regulator|nr:sigma-54 dependent transcriptional regulator [Chitinophagaceae bacterium]